MIRSAVTVSLVEQAKGGPFVFGEGLEAACASAARLGFDAVEVFPPDAGAVDRRMLHELMQRHGLRVAAFGTGGGWLTRGLHLTHGEAPVRAAARGFVRSVIELGAGFGAPAIIGSMQGKAEANVPREQAVAWLAEALNDLGNHAASHGVPLLYEPLNRYETNLFTRQREAARFLASLETGNVKLLCDLFHMNIEEASVAGTLREVATSIGHIHFADSNRQAMGFGHTDAAALTGVLMEVGYEGYLSAEILPLPDAETAARQTIATIRRLLPAGAGTVPSPDTPPP